MSINHDAVGRILVANSDVAISVIHIAHLMEDHRQHHHLPKLLKALAAAHQRLLEVVAAGAPEVAAALARDLDSVEDLHASEKVTA